MSFKRKRNDQADGDLGADMPVEKKQYKSGKPNHKPKTQRGERYNSEKGGKTPAQMKSRIRDLKRLLEHVDNEEKHKMPANVRIERERELATLQHELAEKTATKDAAERRRNLISKYHHIRFFDRRKATRILEKLRRQLAAAETAKDESKVAELQQEIHDAEVALNYSIYYPLMKPYSALYPRSTKQEKGELEENTEEPETGVQKKLAKAKGDPEMWAAVERAMEEGTLDVLRNSEESAPVVRRTRDEDVKKDKKKDKKKFKAKEPAPGDLPPVRRYADGEESDGGFFE